MRGVRSAEGTRGCYCEQPVQQGDAEFGFAADVEAALVAERPEEAIEEDL